MGKRRRFLRDAARAATYVFKNVTSAEDRGFISYDETEQMLRIRGWWKKKKSYDKDWRSNLKHGLDTNRVLSTMFSMISSHLIKDFAK